MANVLTLTEENFEKEVMESSVPVMVDFWATWCMPCKMVVPIIEEMARDYSERLKIAKLNVDDAIDVATRFRVMNIPTLIFFDKGREIGRMVGVVSKDSIAAKMQELLPAQ